MATRPIAVRLSGMWRGSVLGLALGACLLGGALGPAFGAGCASAGELGHGPSASLRDYADALTEGRVEDAYRLLSDDAKRSVSLEAFRRMVLDNPEEVAEIAASLRRSALATTVTATVLTPDGEQLLLVLEGGGWRVDATGIDRYGQATPRQAIEGFLRAFDRKRYDVIMRYVPSREVEAAADLDWRPLGSEPLKAPQAGATGSVDAGADAGAGPGPDGGVGTPAPDGPVPALTAQHLEERWEGDQQQFVSRIVQAIKAALPTARIEETGDRAAMPYGAGGTVLFVRENGLWKIEDLQ